MALKILIKKFNFFSTAMTDTLDIFCRDSVDISRAYNELRKSVPGKDNPDNDAEANEDESFNLPIEEIPDAMSPARDQVAQFDTDNILFIISKTV